MDSTLSRIYHDVQSLAGFASVRKLYKTVKEFHPEITQKYVTEWLSKQKSYSLLKPIRNKFQRNRVLVAGLNEEFQADLLDVSNLSTSNKNTKFILTAIDVLSKYGFAVPLKRKTAAEVRNGFQIIFNERVPALIQTDDGNEFKGTVQQLFEDNGVMHIPSNDSRIKCSVAERFNKTLRLKIAKYLRFTGKRNYIDVLQDIVKTYNSTVHSAINMRPIDVTVDTQKQAFVNLYGNRSYREMLLEAFRKQTKLKIGDFVRVRVKKSTFGRGYQDNWSTQLYRILYIHQTGTKPMYRVVDAKGVPLKKKYYNEDLQKITPNEHNITLTGRKRTRRGNTEVEVTYEGLTTPVWIPENSVFNEL